MQQLVVTKKQRKSVINDIGRLFELRDSREYFALHQRPQVLAVIGHLRQGEVCVSSAA
jgi:hypothetical protein